MSTLEDLHEGPRKEGHSDHRQPRGHLGESPHDIAEGNVGTELVKLTIEGVEEALVGRNTLILLSCVEHRDVLDQLGSGRGSVKGDVAHSGRGLSLVGERDREEHVVE